MAMKFYPFFMLSLFVLISCKSEKEETQEMAWSISEQKTFQVPSSIRAMQVVDENTVWFAGSGGVFGYTYDRGKSWEIDSIEFESQKPHFRSIAIAGNKVFLLSIASPALLFKSEDNGQSWDLVFREDHPNVFFDAMKFWDEIEGIAMGDPIGGCLSIIVTRDGGDSWSRIPCSDLPVTDEGEAAFAASNSNISIVGDHAWVVSGGANARVFHTPDKGRTWSVYDTPIISGESMTGIFTSDFWDEKNGIVFGGNWNEKEKNTENKAKTSDGGKTWQLIADGQEPGYRSHVKYFPDGNGKEIIAVGIPGISFSKDGGDSWKALSKESFYTVDFSPVKNEMWLAGDQKISWLKLNR